MCTSLTLSLPDGSQLFGRTLDWHEHFHEQILRIPRGFLLDPEHKMDKDASVHSRYAILGMGTEAEGYPLLADGMNDHGLCMAGLRFAASARYLPVTAMPPEGAVCLAPWEMMPYVLGFCATLDEAREALARVRVVNRPFSTERGESIPNAPLHWHISDGGGGSLVAEATARGLELHTAPLGVMANDPTYPAQVAAYEGHLRAGKPLPEGYDSTARFIRAACLREHTVDMLAEEACDPIAAFFDMAAQVSPPAGAVPAVGGKGWQTTLYTCCMDGARGKYYYTTAESTAVHEVRI